MTDMEFFKHIKQGTRFSCVENGKESEYVFKSFKPFMNSKHIMVFYWYEDGGKRIDGMKLVDEKSREVKSK